MARWSSRHRTIVLVLWLVALAGSFGASQAAGTSFPTRFQLPGTQSGTALSLLQKDFPAASGSSDQIVLHATSGTLRDPAVQARAQRMLQQVGVPLTNVSPAASERDYERRAASMTSS